MPAIATATPMALDRLLALNPHLCLADILVLWHWTGPSRRLH
ncbi:hypothetical protein [Solidesulfovibrio sp.]